MQLRVAICDDERIICEEIKRQLLFLRPNYEIFLYDSGEKLLKESMKFQIIFLDIEMKELDGMKTAELLLKRGCSEHVIFLTAHTEYMAEAFKVRAFRFLQKPIEAEAFREAVKEAEREILDSEKLIINTGGMVRFININDILYFEAYGDGTYIYLKDEVLQSNKTLKYWVKMVEEEHFFQVHRSYLVAFRYVKSIKREEVVMHFVKQPVPVSRRKTAAFRQAFIMYVQKYAKYI